MVPPARRPGRNVEVEVKAEHVEAGFERNLLSVPVPGPSCTYADANASTSLASVKTEQLGLPLHSIPQLDEDEDDLQDCIIVEPSSVLSESPSPPPRARPSLSASSSKARSSRACALPLNRPTEGASSSRSKVRSDRRLSSASARSTDADSSSSEDSDSDADLLAGPSASASSSKAISSRRSLPSPSLDSASFSNARSSRRPQARPEVVVADPRPQLIRQPKTKRKRQAKLGHEEWTAEDLKKARRRVRCIARQLTWQDRRRAEKEATGAEEGMGPDEAAAVAGATRPMSPPRIRSTEEISRDVERFMQERKKEMAKGDGSALYQTGKMKRAPRVCSVCFKTGHNRRKCQAEEL